jgi:uncharacterized membrane protein
MNKNRLEAFSDGVLAIIITIMVLELKVPDNPTWNTYVEYYPIFASYALSFALVGICWATHSHLFHSAKKIDNKVLTWNMFLLFWQSLIPFTTASMGNSNFSNISVAVYAIIMFLGLLVYIFLVNSLIKLHGINSEFSRTCKGGLRTYLSAGITLFSAIISIIGFPKLAFIIIALAGLSWYLSFHLSDKKQAKKE